MKKLVNDNKQLAKYNKQQEKKKKPSSWMAHINNQADKPSRC